MKLKVILTHVVVVLLAALVVYALCAGLARGAAPVDCGLTYVLGIGDPERCAHHVSVPTDVLADLMRTEAALAQAKADLEHERELRILGEERDAALLAACNQSRAACEASRVPPVCSEPGTWARPGVAWPVGIGLGFVGGFVAGHWGVPR